MIKNKIFMHQEKEEKIMSELEQLLKETLSSRLEDIKEQIKQLSNQMTDIEKSIQIRTSELGKDIQAHEVRFVTIESEIKGINSRLDANQKKRNITFTSLIAPVIVALTMGALLYIWQKTSNDFDPELESLKKQVIQLEQFENNIHGMLLKERYPKT